MGQLSVTIVTSLVLFLTYYFLMFSVVVKASAIPSSGTSSSSTSDEMIASNVQSDINRNLRMFKPLSYGYKFNRNIRSPFSNSIGQRMIPVAAGRAKVPLEMDLLMDDDDLFDKSKRYDDYGHMRFGKRGDDQFDDYGHMRFGKRGE